MIPTSFDESNHVLDKPKDMAREQCDALSVFVGQTQDGLPVVISCWKLTKEELEQINKTGRVWLWVYGAGMPPVSLTVENPFKSQ
jgi:hypothetical protein